MTIKTYDKVDDLPDLNGDEPKKVGSVDDLPDLSVKKKEEPDLLSNYFKNGGVGGSSAGQSERKPSLPKIANQNLQIDKDKFEDDPVGTVAGVVYKNMESIRMPDFSRASSSSTRVAKAPPKVQVEDVRKETEKPTYNFTLKEADKLVRETKKVFDSDTRNAEAHLMKRTGVKDPKALYSDDINLKEKLQPGNATDQIAYERIQEAKTANKSIQEGGSLEDMAVAFAANRNPQVAKQIAKLRETGVPLEQPIGEVLSGNVNMLKKSPSSAFSNATLGKYMFEAFNNSAFVQELEKNPELYQKYRQELPNLVTNYPDFGKMMYGNILSQKMEDMGINNGILNVVTKDELDRVTEQAVLDGDIDEFGKLFIDKEIRPEVGLKNFFKSLVGKPTIRTTGAIENTLEGLTTGVINIPKGVYEATARNLVTSEQDRLKGDLEAEDKGVGVKPKNVSHEITMQGGQFLGQSLAIASGGSLFKSLGVVNNLNKAIALSGGVQAYANYIPEARKRFPGDPLKQAGFAAVLSGLEIVTEGVFKDRKTMDGLLGNVKATVASTIKDFTEKRITAEAAEGGLESAIRSALTGAKQFGVAVGENTTEEVVMNFGEQVAKAIFSGIPIKDAIDGEELWNTARQAALGSGFIGALAARADMKKNKGITAKTIYDMAKDEPSLNFWKEQILESAKQDETLEKEAPDKIRNLEYAAKIIDEMAGTGMSERQKVKFLITELEKKVAQDKADSKSVAAFKNKEVEIINESNKVQDELISGKDDGVIDELDKSDKEIEDHASVIQSAIDNGILKGMDKMTAEAALQQDGGVDEFLKDVSNQALNLSSEDRSMDEVNMKRARQVYGDQLVDIAIEKFPKEKSPTEPSVIMPGEIPNRETTTIAPKELPKEEKSKGPAIILPKPKELVPPEKPKDIGIAFAPYRSKNINSIEEDDEVRNSEDYKLHQTILNEVAKGLGLTIDAIRNTWGGYVDSETSIPVQEVSNVARIKATRKQARLIAAVMGKAAPEMQDSVLVGSYDEDGEGLEHHISTGNFENARKAIKWLKDNDLQYFTVDKDDGSIIILDLDSQSTPQIINFVKQLNENGIPTEHQYQPVSAEFIGKEDYDGIIAEDGREVREQTGFDIDAYVKEASRRYEAIKQGKRPTIEATAKSPEQTSDNEGTPPAEPPKPPTEKSTAPFVERPETELSHRGLQDVANEFSLPDVEVRDRKSDDELQQEARETVETWTSKGQYEKKIEGLITKASDGEILTDTERVILEGHLANLTDTARKVREEKGIKSKEYDDALSEVSRVKIAGQKTRSEAGAALRVPTFRSRPRTIEDEMATEMEASGVDVLTDRQKETVEKEFEGEQKLREQYENKLQELRDENAKLKAAEVISKERNRARKGRKSKGEFAEERKKIVEDIREKLRKARGDTQATIIPYAKELIAISPEIGKLVTNLYQQGVTELSEIIDNIHDILSPDIPDITKRDVRDLIAGEYNEKKPTKNELTAAVYNLRREAQLLNELEELEKGEVPITEKKRIERNRKIADLKQKIKEHDTSKIADEKKKIESKIRKIEEQLKKGDFAPPPKKPKIKLDGEGKELQAKLANLEKERAVRRLTAEYAKRTLWQKGVDKAVEVANIPRSVMASTDFSAPLNQAIIATIAYPSLAKEAAAEMFKSAFSQQNFDSWFYGLKEDPRYELMKELKLGIADPHSPFLTAKEEAFMSGYAEQIPVAGRLIKGSERAYVQYLNKMRVDLFNRFVDRFEEKGKTYENSKKLYEKTARYINNITGRGSVGKLEQFAPIFNALFFSPRLIASRINLLNPVYFATLPNELKAQYGKDMGKFLGLGSIILTLFSLYGKTQDDDDEDKITVETDPRSSDFGKIKQGQTRWNVWGGFQPYVRVAAQVGTGQKKTTTSGVVQELDGEKAFGQTRGSMIADFFRGKLAPVFSSAVDLIEGRNAVGEKTTLKGELVESIIPLSIGSVIDAWKERGYGSLYSVGLPSIFGVATQTYGEKGPTIPEKIKVGHKSIDLTKEQKSDLEKFITDKTEKDIKKLKTLPEYKAVSREEQVALEALVKRGVISHGKKYITGKYKSSFPKETPKEKAERIKAEKEKDSIMKKLNK